MRAAIESDPASVALVVGDVGQQRGRHRAGRAAPSPTSPTSSASRSTPTPCRPPGTCPSTSPPAGPTCMSVTAHKLGGPIGIGALVARRDATLVPLTHGGGQERQVRSGTLDTPAIVGFAAALVEATASMDGRGGPPGGAARRPHRARHGARARHPAVRGVAARRRRAAGCPATRTCSCRAATVTPCSTCSTRPASRARPGSACQAGVPQPSHVLLAMGVAESDARGALRVTLGHTSTERRRRRVPRRAARGHRARPRAAAGGDRVVRVVAAMSGGVDSAVAAARMLDAGHEVVGVHLALSQSAATLRESARGCCTIEDAGDARRVADVLGHPVLRLGHGRPLQARRRRRLPRRVRRRPHPQPVPALQREDQVRRPARQGGRPRLRRGRHRPLRPGRRDDRRPRGSAARAAPRRRHGQGPELRPRRARRRPARPRPSSRSATRRSRRSARRRRERGFYIAQEAGQPRHLLHPRRRHPGLADAAARRGARRHRRHRR